LIGSPLGFFISGHAVSEINLESMKKYCANLYNIYHPSDVIAYRLESFLYEESKLKPPVKLPYYKNN
jgi:hypothetical protein